MPIHSTTPHLPLITHDPRLLVGEDMNPDHPALRWRAVEPVCAPLQNAFTQRREANSAFLPLALRLFMQQWLRRIDHRSQQRMEHQIAQIRQRLIAQAEMPEDFS